MDFEFIEKFYLLFVKAGILTCQIAFLGIVFSILIGIFCMAVKFYKLKFLSKLVDCYVELSRNTPLLIQLFFLYYGLPKLGVSMSGFTCAVAGLGFEAVRRSQIEAGLSIALSKNQLLRYVILPQAFSVALPSISANVIFLLKETSIVSIVALADLVYVAKDLIGLYYKTDEALFMLVISYLVIILPVSLALSYVEKRVRNARS